MQVTPLARDGRVLVTFQPERRLQRGHPHRHPQRPDHHLRLRRRAAPRHLDVGRSDHRAGDGHGHRALRQPDPPLLRDPHARTAGSSAPTRSIARTSRASLADLVRPAAALQQRHPRAQRRVLPAHPRPHHAAQRLVRVAVGARHRRARASSRSCSSVAIAPRDGDRVMLPASGRRPSALRRPPLAERRPFRDNPRLDPRSASSCCSSALVAMVTLADRSTELNPDFLSEVVLYARLGRRPDDAAWRSPSCWRATSSS